MLPSTRVLVALLLLAAAGCRTGAPGGAAGGHEAGGPAAAGVTPGPMDLSKVEYVQSATCIRCHPQRLESWRRTFHRTMTQRAGPASVLGDFDNATYTYQGIRSRFFRDGDRYMMETLGRDGVMHLFEVVMTVGSRRLQQYVTAIGDQNWRLPLAWNIEERRWFHLNAGFLDPDGIDFNYHTGLWNANCVFCHNTKPDPGADWEKHTFSTRVAEMGIACEACHGPGKAHIDANRDPFRRYALYRSASERDGTIYSPHELPKDRRLMICGHCHGQRLPNPRERIQEIMESGDPYTAGDDLNRWTTPVWQDTHLEGADLSLRFWKDGTPRLTAYEYQGLLMSPDYQKGELTCISCHSMHEGDPRGMITAEKLGPAACSGCHAKLTADIPAHTMHKAGSTGSDCYACHMPRMVYGILRTHRSHRMQNPDPSRAWRHDMPEACTICHTDRTARWAATEMARQYKKDAPRDLPEGAEFGIAENVRALFGGDVVQRAVAIEAFGSAESYDPDPLKLAWAAPFLILAMEDSYPAIRHFAYRALRRVVERSGALAPAFATGADRIPWFDPQAEPAVRREIVAMWWRWWRAAPKDRLVRPGDAVPLDADWMPRMDAVAPLVASRDNRTVQIGE